MRIWDIPAGRLCDRHLLGEHVELHAIWTVLTQGRKGYSRHPETLRWKGKLKALYEVHEVIAGEMKKRGFEHKSPLDAKLAVGEGVQNEHVNPSEQQAEILRGRKCGCRIP